ncbi:hypothetical protein AUR64_03915 [Haloprofundus marisrubri]|uniref:MrfA-like Zn-binding domain-containing protein n=2 Tax=Haloprofundus marisrubri TaxID=1514971 RepID=A0A0W1RDC9_9EURY|nr:hypothetical protein AUR64_03915 [Haloprofundus marisrubri]
MVKSALYLQDREISLAALEDSHKTTHDPYQWEVGRLDESDRDVLLEFWGLRDLYTVRDVTSLTAVYGYQTRVSAQGTDLSDSERLTRTFDHRDNMKRAYVARTNGRGLVFDVDTDRLYATVENAVSELDAANYDQLAAQELAVLDGIPVKELVDDEHDLVLTPLLHALEHALYQAASQEIGMDNVLGSKLLIEDGAIVLYERENVGSGGLAQLTLDEQGSVLKKFLRNAAEQLAHCGQFCSKGCPSCLYVDDFHCRPYLPSEVNRWVPPNALLNREIADEFIHAH